MHAWVVSSFSLQFQGEEEKVDCRFFPTMFMTSVVLFFGTFAIATALKRFKGAIGVID